MQLVENQKEEAQLCHKDRRLARSVADDMHHGEVVLPESDDAPAQEKTSLSEWAHECVARNAEGAGGGPVGWVRSPCGQGWTCGL